MYIVRWLGKHPIIAIWALTIVALLLSMGGGKKHETDVASNEHAKVSEQSKKVSESAENHSTRAESSAAAIIPSEKSQAQGNDNVQQEESNGSIAGLNEQSSDDLLLMAREAYWNNGLDEAASIYQQLIEREPHVVAHKGELGNVYWKQGFPEKSAILYAEIAIPMIKNGKADRVENMVGFIEQFHPDKATEIRKHLQGLSK